MMNGLLIERLAATIDLTLAVKQAHWNLKGTGFVGVHELLDIVADHLREAADQMAERAVILGGVAYFLKDWQKGAVEFFPQPTRVTYRWQ